MDPKNRVLLKVTVEDMVKVDKLFNQLLGNKAEERKKWINKNVDFDGVVMINYSLLLVALLTYIDRKK